MLYLSATKIHGTMLGKTTVVQRWLRTIKETQ